MPSGARRAPHTSTALMMKIPNVIRELSPLEAIPGSRARSGGGAVIGMFWGSRTVPPGVTRAA